MNISSNFSLTIVLILQIISYLNGQTNRFFNSRLRNPQFAQRRFFSKRVIGRPKIPSFIDDQLAWAYANREAFIPDQNLRTRSRTRNIGEKTRTRNIAERTRARTIAERPKQYNQKGKVFGHCDIGNDEDLDELFPGLFQSETEILSETSSVIKKERWYADKMRTYGPAKSKVPQTIESTTQRLALETNITEIVVTRPPPSINGPPICQCCQTESQHEVYRNITIDSRTYPVIQLPGKFQAVPVGRCPQTNLCLHGDCVQHYSVHNVLIWNETVPYWPPFDFASIEYPTHCTWENIGK